MLQRCKPCRGRLPQAAAHALAVEGVSRGCIPKALLAYSLAVQAVQQLLHRALISKPSMRVGGGCGMLVHSSSAAGWVQGKGDADGYVALTMLTAPDDCDPSGQAYTDRAPKQLLS